MREGEVTRRRAINRSVLLTDLSVRLLHAVGLQAGFAVHLVQYYYLVPSTFLMVSNSKTQTG